MCSVWRMFLESRHGPCVRCEGCYSTRGTDYVFGVKDVARLEARTICSVWRILLDSRYGLCVRCEGCCSNRGTDYMFGVKDVARFEARAVCSVWRILLDSRHGLCVRGEGCYSTSNILHTEHIVRAAALQACDRQQSGDIIPNAVSHSLALLKMGKKLPETCWANLKINKFILLHLVGPLFYLNLSFSKLTLPNEVTYLIV